MRVLMLSTDRKILEKNSEVRQRMADYSSVFDELHIIIYTAGGAGPKERIDSNVFIYPTNSPVPISYFFNAYELAGKIIKERKIDAITCQDPFETGLVGWFLKMRFHLPLQLQIHTDIFSSYFLGESFKNKLRVWLAKFLLPKADGVRVVSERIRQSLKSNVKCQMSNVSVLPVFIDVQKIKSAGIGTDLRKKYPQHDFVFLMASRLTKEKNIDMAIGAFNDIKHQISLPAQAGNVRNPLLLIVGDGPERKALQRSIVKGQLSNVILEPWTDDLVSYYKTADSFLLTSNYEGYGRTVIEAMAAGLPVIMTNVGLAGDILKDNLNGLVVPINNPDELKRAIRILIDNTDKRNDFSRKSAKTVNNFLSRNDYLEKYRASFNFGAVE